MKNVLLLMLVILTAEINAQRGTTAIKFGHFSPAASEGGFIIGYEGGRLLDRDLIFGWSIDWFHRNYVDKKVVNDFNQMYGGVGGSINELRAKTNIHDFPFMISLTGNFPVAPFTKVFLTGGIGAEVLLISYRNFQNPDQDEFKGAFDFNWRLGIGALYMIGRNADIFIEMDYHNSEPSWEYEVDDPNSNFNRTYERVFDMSGLMARLGFRFYY